MTTGHVDDVTERHDVGCLTILVVTVIVWGGFLLLLWVIGWMAR